MYFLFLFLLCFLTPQMQVPSKDHSFLKQCCGRSSFDSKQGISDYIRKKNQLKYLVLNQMKIVHNTFLKKEWTLTRALDTVMIFLVLFFYTVVWSCHLKSKRKQGKIGTGGCRVRSQGRISINFTASATQPNETHRSCSPSDSAVPEQPSEQIANTDCPFRILARHLVCHRTICLMNFCSMIWCLTNQFQNLRNKKNIITHCSKVKMNGKKLSKFQFQF